MRHTIKAQLVAFQPGLYTNYVFKNLDESENSMDRYITVTKCPNWQFSDNFTTDTIGYLEYEFAEAGATYFDISTQSEQQYKYTAYYFINFIKEIRDAQKEYNF